ncbi:MAG: hypothetical protein OXI17_11920 [Gammaproteobacteria bacterium]|nr:hypothetical protein [Gammaproteobacteria bacterium]
MNTDCAMQVFRVFAKKCVNNIDSENHYIQAYPLLLKSTRILGDELGEKAIPAIAHLAYGWMPTIPKNITFDEIQNKKILEACEISSPDESVQFVNKYWGSRSDKPPINNSWVGSSKVLHFINPEMFPIWDTKVARHFTRDDNEPLSDANIRGKHNFYVDYVNFCKQVTKECDKEICIVQKGFRDRINYSVTKFRAIEYVLFSSCP